MTGQLKRAALASLKGKWGLGVGTALLAQIIVGAGSSIVYFPLMIAMAPFVAAGVVVDENGMVSSSSEAGGIFAVIMMMVLYVVYIVLTFFLTGITSMGQSRVFLNIAHGKPISIDGLFEYFRGWARMWKAFKVLFLVSLYTMLWSLLLVIPGIVKSFSYSMTMFILLDHPEYTVRQAITESRRIMNGRKMDLFLLYLSFIGWFLLGMITFGIAFLWILPYMMTAMAHFYKNAVEAANTAE